MKDQLEQVRAFHVVMGQNVRTSPTADLPPREAALRFSLISEEVLELAEAVRERDIVEIADALGDLLYVTYGAILAYGLGDKMTAVFDEIHRTNMAKTPEPGCEHTIHKIVKPPGWTPPNIHDILKG